MPPFSVYRSSWTLGKCDSGLSVDCPEIAKKNNVMCKLCWEIADEQEQENTKQAFQGTYCTQFGCWESAGRAYGWCRKHTVARAADHSAGSGSRPRRITTEADHDQMQQLIAEADSAELHRIIVAAADRLSILAVAAELHRSAAPDAPHDLPDIFAASTSWYQHDAAPATPDARTERSSASKDWY